VSQIQEDEEADDHCKDKLKTEIVAEYPLSSKEDAPMTLAATGKVVRFSRSFLTKDRAAAPS
jgi:hypothetical protein